ncbi:hypothetical protein GJU40_18120 [Bacillus lacus]|uniref:SGNH hydrolase-type esterase domain-containing protein n=1 Tax=Metabacillus lacus TaxID=1983721 RepID=A0A7X2J233_9BACI|nr:GDSL-type esterase/lipase family protein [Metabacillus lacus]MRX74042.1 hypothetical protein [Metabacillus lacus]
MKHQEAWKYFGMAASAAMVFFGLRQFAPAYQVRQFKKNPQVTGGYLESLERETLYHIGLGDSVARGYGSQRKGFVGIANQLLEQKLNKPFHLENFGKDSITSDKLLSMMTEDHMQVSIGQADIVTINIGGNDILKIAMGKGPMEVITAFRAIKNSYHENITEIVRQVRELNSECIIVLNELYNPVPVTEPHYSASVKLVDIWNAVLYKLAAKDPKIIIIPSARLLLASDRDTWAYDEIHPNDNGNEKMAEMMVQLLLTPPPGRQGINIAERIRKSRRRFQTN